jgi:hypothetical protein
MRLNRNYEKLGSRCGEYFCWKNLKADWKDLWLIIWSNGLEFPISGVLEPRKAKSHFQDCVANKENAENKLKILVLENWMCESLSRFGLTFRPFGDD